MAVKEPLKIALVGCGGAAQGLHIPSLRKIGNADLLAVCDNNEDLAKRAAKRFNISRYYADFSEMLQKERLDIVDICTPPKSHATLSIQAMEAGCHVLVEKPIASSVREADEMVSASKRNQVRLCIAHNMLFQPVVMTAKSIISQGGIGDVTGIDIRFSMRHKESIADKNHWYHRLPGGIFGEILPHPIYLAMSFLGYLEPVAVCTKKLSSYDWVVADELRVILKSKSGLATITSSHNWSRDTIAFDIFGTRMSLRIDINNGVLIRYGRGSQNLFSIVLQNLSQSLQWLTGTASAALDVISHRYHNGTYTLIQKFTESIQKAVESPVTGEEGREVMRLYEKIIAQIQAKRD